MLMIIMMMIVSVDFKKKIEVLFGRSEMQAILGGRLFQIRAVLEQDEIVFEVCSCVRYRISVSFRGFYVRRKADMNKVVFHLIEHNKGGDLFVLLLYR